jgi:hypothetical protein
MDLKNYYIKTVFGLFAALTFLVLFSSCEKRRTPTAYELPKNYTGWVTVKYEKPGAPPLKETDGYLKIKISDNGFAETSSKIEEGWAEDKYYWIESGKEKILPEYTEDKKSMIHSGVYKTADYLNFVNPDTLPAGKEVTLIDGSKFTKLDDKGGLSYKSGRYFLYLFYVSSKPEDIWDFTNYNLPPIPPEHEMW